MMKKIILLFIAILSTSALLAQSSELAAKEKTQTIPAIENGVTLGAIDSSNENSNKRSIQEKSNSFASNNSDYQLEAGSNNNTIENKLKENEAKSKAAKQKRDAKSDAIALRLKQSEKNKAASKKQQAEQEKQKADFEQKRAEAKRKALQSYVAPSPEELARKKSNK